MRLNIKLHHAPNILVPFDYQYAIQEWIYRTLSRHDHDLATKLHDVGYTLGGKQFKLFSFGRWQSFPYKQELNGYRFTNNHSEITISFLLPEILESFVTGCFLNSQHTFHFKHGIKIPISTSEIVLAEPPHFVDGTMHYRLITGARISLPPLEKGKHQQYISPNDTSDYGERLVRNLMHKLQASNQVLSAEQSKHIIQFILQSDIRSQKINVPKNGDTIESIVYKYDFALDAPAPIHRTLYYAGAGEENTLGMGWVEIIH